MSSLEKEKSYFKTSSQKYYMQPSEPTIVQLFEETHVECLGKEKKEEKHLRLGIVVMTKRPIEFEEWLRYHFYTIGVERFYVRCEDTPELASIVQKAPWSYVVEVEYIMQSERDYFVQMDRQANNVSNAIQKAKIAGLDWLLHIDDDELLYCPHGPQQFFQLLRSLDGHICEAHMQNIEALVPTDECIKPFTSCTCFVISTTKFASYTNGKSIGRISCLGGSLKPHGPHHFRCATTNNKSNVKSRSVQVAPAIGVILHYESCTYERWSQKYCELALRHGHDKNIHTKLPFPFYRDSLDAMLTLNYIQYALSKTLQPEFGIHLLSRHRQHKNKLSKHLINLPAPIETSQAVDILAFARYAYNLWASHKLESIYCTLLAQHEFIHLSAVQSLLSAPRIFSHSGTLTSTSPYSHDGDSSSYLFSSSMTSSPSDTSVPAAEIATFATEMTDGPLCQNHFVSAFSFFDGDSSTAAFSTHNNNFNNIVARPSSPSLSSSRISLPTTSRRKRNGNGSGVKKRMVNTNVMYNHHRRQEDHARK
uniref:Glycosyltransferase family 92 protein n=1 Tax=Aureoumbra lagunensis TaxID=44058 RepID=A0A6S8CGW5_9STRA|mmetsp:Transcript_8977/g.13808  ORF Transcript_8977/g.13808 Transcript_8977/m.13808 type:complete len:535 (-) Transcript_8977:251-1855(-)